MHTFTYDFLFLLQLEHLVVLSIDGAGSYAKLYNTPLYIALIFANLFFFVFITLTQN